MADIIRAEACCGLRELDGLSRHKDPVEAMKTIVTEVYGPQAICERDAAGKPINPYRKPKNTPWQGSHAIWGPGRYWLQPDGTRVYEYQANEWDDDQRYGYDDDWDHRWRYAVFTQAGARKTYGKKFAALIKKEGLGEVVQATTKSVKNPNSGNILKAWIWTVNHKALRAWAQKQAVLAAKGAK